MRDALTRYFRQHKWLAALVLAAIFVLVAALDGARLHRARERLGQQSFTRAVELGVAITAALAVVAVLLIKRLVSGSMRKALAGLAIGGWFITFLWEHPRYSHASMTSAHDVVMTVVSDLPLLLLGLLVLFYRAAGLRWTPAAHPAPAVSGHKAEVWYVIDNQKRPTFEPYFIAHCSCDWTGPARSGPQAEQEAFHDARSHTPDVTSEVQRPLG